MKKLGQIKSAIILSYLTQGVNLLVGLTYTPLILRLLGQNEYGLYQLSISTISYLSLLSFGVNSSYLRFYSPMAKANRHDDIARLNSTFFMLMSAASVLALVGGTVLTLLTDQLYGATMTATDLLQMRRLMPVLTINVVATFIDTVFECYIMAKERLVFHRGVNLLLKISIPLITTPLLFLGAGSMTIVVVTTVLSFVKLLANVLVCKNKLTFKFSFKNLKFSLVKEIWAFSAFVFLSIVVDQVNWNVDRLLLGSLSGAAAVSIYSVGAQFNTMFLHLSTAISSAFSPRINRLVAQGESNQNLTALFTRVGTTQFLILALALTGFLFFGKPFINFWAGKQYQESYYVILILLVAVLIPAIQNMGLDIQRAKNMHKARAIFTTIMAAVNIGLSIPLIRLAGPTGAAIGTAVSMLMGNVFFMNIYYHKRIGLDMIYFWKHIFRMVPALAPPIALGVAFALWWPVGSLWTLALQIAAYGLVFAVSMLFLWINKEGRAQLIARLVPKKQTEDS